VGFDIKGWDLRTRQVIFTKTVETLDLRLPNGPNPKFRLAVGVAGYWSRSFRPVFSDQYLCVACKCYNGFAGVFISLDPKQDSKSAPLSSVPLAAEQQITPVSTGFIFVEGGLVKLWNTKTKQQEIISQIEFDIGKDILLCMTPPKEGGVVCLYDGELVIYRAVYLRLSTKDFLASEEVIPPGEAVGFQDEAAR
jgi:hypothetical protein